MISMLAASVIACSGQTKNLKLEFTVDFTKNVISGTLADAQGVAEVRYENLRRERGCMLSSELSFCYSAQHGIASIDLVMNDGTTSHVERGSMKCQ